MKAKVNGINEFDLSEVVDINVSLSINDDKIIFRKDGINYHARLISQDVQSKKYTIEIEKKLFEGIILDITILNIDYITDIKKAK